jgi:methyl-accepting chemotaxis protein
VVLAGASALAKAVQDSEAKSLLDQFVSSDAVLNAKYESAYQVYINGNADFKAADKMVRGQDRAPTDLFDKLVARLQSRVQATIAAQQKAVHQMRNWALIVSGGLLAFFGLLGFLTVRSIVQRLALLQAVSKRLANADLTGLSIDISGKDEIGEFGESMKGVHAAMEELLHLAESSHANAA